MKKEDFFKSISDTFFEELFMMQEEDLVYPDVKIKPEDDVVGRMNKLEKNIYSLLIQKSKELAGRMKKPGDQSEIGLAINNFASYKLSIEIDVLRNFMWLIIQDRFDAYTKNLGIREGFVIISFEKSEECEGCSNNNRMQAVTQKIGKQDIHLN